MSANNGRDSDDLKSLTYALRQFESALDELAESIDSSEADDVELAILSVDSALWNLKDSYEDHSSMFPSKLDFPTELGRIDSESLGANVELSESAVRDMKSIIDEMPSNGEQQDQQLEQLNLLADSLYNDFEDIYLS